MDRFPETYPWERTPNGLKAQREPDRQVKPHNFGRAISIASTKMKDICGIRADFHGERVYFLPYIDVWFERNAASETEILAIYEADIEHDDNEPSTNDLLPQYCLRRVQWDHRQDATQYHKANSKKEYLLGENQVNAISVFITSMMYPQLPTLIDELKALALQGIALTSVQRRPVDWQRVQVRLRTLTFDLDCSYTSIEHQNEELERWLIQWQKVFSEVDYTSGIFPNENFFITYPPSLEEEIELFPG